MIMQWISVKDRLPENTNLLVVRYCRTDTNEHLGIALTYYTKQYGTNEYDFDFNSSTQPTKVTHWMPLPPPSDKE